jgi:hypothetical protein
MSRAIRRRTKVFTGLDADGGAVVDWKAVMAGRAAKGRSEPATGFAQALQQALGPDPLEFGGVQGRRRRTITFA